MSVIGIFNRASSINLPNVPSDNKSAAKVGTSTSVGSNPSGSSGLISSCMGDLIAIGKEMNSNANAVALAQFNEIQANAQRVRDSTLASVIVDSVTVELTKPDATGDLPADVLKYLQHNNIAFGPKNNQGIVDYLKSINKTDGKGLNKGEFESIKGALEADAVDNNVRLASNQRIFEKMLQTHINGTRAISEISKLMGDSVAGFR